MKLIKWKEEYSVNVKEIDKQHKNIFKHLNNLYTAMKDSEKNVSEEVLEKLSSYVDYHFNTEEKYFEQFNYPEKEAHISEHNIYRRKIKEFREKLSEESVELPFEMIDFLENWILEHVTGTDKKYKKFFNDNGLN